MSEHYFIKVMYVSLHFVVHFQGLSLGIPLKNVLDVDFFSSNGPKDYVSF